MKVSELMSSVDYFVSLNHGFADVIAIMQQHENSCVLVCDGSKPIGIVTERDIVRSYTAISGDGTLPRLEDVYTANPICVKESTELEHALILTRSASIRHLPVVDDDDHLVGVVTQKDMTDAFLKSLESNAALLTANEKLTVLSLEDPLLGIGNRRAMEVDLEFSVANSQRYHQAFSIALIDVDYFKRYNDQYGHQSGDLALQSIVACINSEVRQSDKIFRYGGEEILLLMPHTGERGAKKTTERILNGIQNKNIEHVDSPLNILTVSIGYATSNGTTWQQLVKRADDALYQAKCHGRNRVCSYRLLEAV